jgi:hypothetical protein
VDGFVRQFEFPVLPPMRNALFNFCAQHISHVCSVPSRAHKRKWFAFEDLISTLLLWMQKIKRNCIQVSSSLVHDICFGTTVKLAIQKEQTNLDRLVFLMQKTIISFKMASVFCFIIPINSTVNCKQGWKVLKFL